MWSAQDARGACRAADAPIQPIESISETDREPAWMCAFSLRIAPRSCGHVRRAHRTEQMGRTETKRLLSTAGRVPERHGHHRPIDTRPALDGARKNGTFRRIAALTTHLSTAQIPCGLLGRSVISSAVVPQVSAETARDGTPASSSGCAAQAGSVRRCTPAVHDLPSRGTRRRGCDRTRDAQNGPGDSAAAALVPGVRWSDSRGCRTLRASTRSS